MAQWIRPDINIDFVGQRRKFLTFSSIAVGLSIAVLVFNIFVRGSALNYGTDFRGGSQIQIEFAKPVTTAQIRKALAAANYRNAEVVKMKEANRNNFYMLRLTEVSSFTPAQQAHAKEAIQKAFPFKLRRFDYKEGGDKLYLVFKKTMNFDMAAEQLLKNEARAKARRAEQVAAGIIKKTKPEAKKPETKKPEAKKPEAKSAATQAAGSQPTTQAAGSQPATQAAGSQPATQAAGSRPTSLAAGSQPTTKPAVVATKTPKKPKGPALSLRIAKVLRDAKIEVTQVQLFGRGQDRTFEVSLGGLGGDLRKAFERGFGAGVVKDIPQVESVGAKMGRQLRNDGIKSVLYALLLMLVYIAFRFDFRYAPGAIVALAHDVTITVGLFAVTWTEFSLPVIAALLTISGYSINDTIVVYDRIRENVARLRDRKFPLVVNASINETLSRTLLTSLTTLFTTVSIWVMGTGVLKVFAFALTAGVLVGTYSSIFVASPLVVALNERIDAAKRKSGKATR